MANKRNIDLHTKAEDARRNILLGLLDAPRGTNKSGLAYLAFPDYNFKAPQGAAFAIAKIARQMEDEKLLVTDYHRSSRGEYMGYSIKLSRLGREMAEALKAKLPPPKPECPACGNTDYEGDLRTCPHCEGLKCSGCDMGNDVGCPVCDTAED